jgi:tetratricopeptide (TPR) repeat protein
MSSAGDKDTQKHQSRIKVFLIVAYVLLLIMAFLSSLDAAFVYIFLGASLFFAFMALRQWWSVAGEKFSFADQFTKGSKQGFSFKQPRSASWQSKTSEPSPTSPESKNRRVAIVIAVFVLSIFIGIIVLIVFSVNSSEDENELMFYQSVADEYLNNGDLDSAYLLYRRTTLLDETFDEGYYGLGLVKEQQEQVDSAVFYYDKAISIDPDNVNALYRLGWIHYLKDEHARSLAILRDAIQKSENFSAAYVVAGHNYYARNMYDSALMYYEPAYAQGFRSAEFLNILAYIYDTQGRAGEAVAYYEETLQYDTTLVDVYKRLGELVPGEEGSRYRARATGQQW